MSKKVFERPLSPSGLVCWPGSPSSAPTVGINALPRAERCL
jgi:hypothetical protein